MQIDNHSVFELLKALLPPPPPARRAAGFAGFGKRFASSPWLSSLRSFSQVIFINHPLSGALLLLAFLLVSPWMALLAGVGMAAANLTSRLLGLASTLRDQGIHGFNGVLVGCAGASLLHTSALNRVGLVVSLVALGGSLTTLMLELWSGCFHRRGDPPVLTLPFCLVTWCLLILVSPPSPDPIESVQISAAGGTLQALLLGLPHSFGQVFLCSGLASGVLVLLAVVIASPMAAALGASGAMVGMVTALTLSQGADQAAVAQGLWGYNGLLVAIALGGIFHAPGVKSLLMALAGAGLATLLQAVQLSLISNLPPLTLSFVLTTWLLQRLASKGVPALIPVSLHAVVTPEEHRKRFLVARELLGRFRCNLRQRIAGTAQAAGLVPLSPSLQKRAQHLFQLLDRDCDGSLSLDELREALLPSRSSNGASDQSQSSLDSQLKATMAAMDFDGDGRIDSAEFSQLIQRLQRLREGEERLLLYLLPVDANGDDRLDRDEMARLLKSIGQPPLTATEQSLVFVDQEQSLRWRDFVDRLLLI